MSKMSIIKQKEIEERKYFKDEDSCSLEDENHNIDIDNYINSNLSLENCFTYKEKLFKKSSAKDVSIKTNDSIDDKDEENNDIRSILSDLNKNIELNINEKENKYNKECQEILNILKFNQSPFRPLLQPKKISMVGKIIFNFSNDVNN